MSECTGLSQSECTGLSHSRFLSYYLNVKFQDKHLAGGYLAINKSTVEELPLVPTPRNVQDQLASLVDEVIAAKEGERTVELKRLERKIDQVVYKLYSLSEQEIAAVEEFYETRS